MTIIFLERILTFIVGAAFVFGSIIFSKESFNDDKNLVMLVFLSLCAIATGIWLCWIALVGFPAQ